MSWRSSLYTLKICMKRKEHRHRVQFPIRGLEGKCEPLGYDAQPGRRRLRRWEIPHLGERTDLAGLAGSSNPVWCGIDTIFSQININKDEGSECRNSREISYLYLESYREHPTYDFSDTWRLERPPLTVDKKTLDDLSATRRN